MNFDNFVITEFENIFTAIDPKGRRTVFKNRHSASFIITLRGSIAFRCVGETVVCDREHPVFLPKGLDYINECTEEAYSLVFSFYTLGEYKSPCVLSPIPEAFAAECYEKIKRAESRQAIFSELYRLADKLFFGSSEKSQQSPTEKAVSYMAKNYATPGLTVKEVAASCFVSEIYLRKLFEKEKGTTPFRFLTELRMERARALALEKRPIKEIALCVGYSDVYQFSRAYKKYFGCSPAKMPR